MRLRTAIGIGSSALLLNACSTYEPEFDAKVPPRNTGIEAIRITSDRLITVPAQRLASASPDMLAALTRAAAIQFRTTGGTGMRVLTRRYADALLQGEVTIDGLRGYYSGNRTDEISRSATLRAGVALMAAYRVTGDARYATAVGAVAAVASRPRFGHEPFRAGFAMRTSRRPRRLSIALTALAAEFFEAASQLIGTSSRRFAVGDLRTVSRNQAAVGRWYAFIGSKTPMTLEQWGSTLASLAGLKSQDAQGITGGGIPAISSAAFQAEGDVRVGPLTRGQDEGFAYALQALAAGPTLPSTAQVFEKGAQRLNGVTPSPTVGAELALAYATWHNKLAER